jgi:hypothetical protein
MSVAATSYRTERTFASVGKGGPSGRPSDFWGDEKFISRFCGADRIFGGLPNKAAATVWLAFVNALNRRVKFAFRRCRNGWHVHCKIWSLTSAVFAAAQ